MKIVLIGAGSAQFGCGTLGDIFQSQKLQGAHITLMDINAKSLDAVYRTGREYIDNKKLHFTLTATTDRATALRDANYIIISIEVGDRFALWDMDRCIPQQFGIQQIYGENGGAGGIFHALRITPPILEICQDVMDICPEAYVFNYSNPMTAISTAVLRKFPDLKFIGLCHEIASLERYLPDILDVDFKDLELRSAGLNHCSVLVEAKYRKSGTDAYPDILAKSADFFEKEPGFSDIWEYVQKFGKNVLTEGSTERLELDNAYSKKAWADRTLFKLILEKFKLLPITVDSHLGEYISWAHDVADHKGILDFYAFYRNMLGAAHELKIDTQVHERVIPIIEGIEADAAYEEAAVNIMNNGLIRDLPDNIVVEVPALVTAKGLSGIAFPDYPKGFAALLRNYTGTYDLTVDAILHGSRELLTQALLVNPVVTVVKNLDEMIDYMLDSQKQWLDYIQ